MRLFPRHRPGLVPRSPAARVVLGVVLALGALVWAFDWNWCRPLIQRYVMSHSGRHIDFDDLEVHVDRSLNPTITLRGVTIENAPWASARQPFIQAGRLSATIAWHSLRDEVKVLNLLVLEDARVDMERRADGLRNWRLVNPEDRGPAHVRVLALDARRSQLHAVLEGVALVADAQTTPLAAPEPFPGHPDLPLTQHLTFAGTVKGQPFHCDTQASAVLTFGATTRRFSVRGVAHVGGLRIEASGLSNDAHALGDFDLDAKATTAGADPAWPLPATVARLRPLVAQGHVAKSGDTWTGSALHLRAGRHTELVADASFVGKLASDTPRRTLKATLHDVVVDLDDIAALRDKAPPGAGAEAPAPRPGAGHAWSADPLDLAPLRGIDADIDLRDARLSGLERGIAQSMRAHLTLAGGLLQVRSLDLGLGGGHVTGTLRLDASRSPADIAIDVSARGLSLAQLSPALAGHGALIGAFDGHATLASHGGSLRELAADAHGHVTASLVGGASVSKRLDAKLGLNGGEWLRTLFDKSARVPVQCASVSFALAHGVATSRHFVFETAETALAGQGSFDLAAETLDATLTPARKKLAPLSMDKAIHAEGSWHGPRITLQPPGAEPPLRCDGAAAR